MYIDTISLKNIACFEDLNLSFSRGGQPCPWVVVLGENGAGKSTLLQMIALALLGGEMIHEIAGGVEWGRFARSSDGSGRVTIGLQATPGDIVGRAPTAELPAGGSFHLETAYDLGPAIRTGLREAKGMHSNRELLERTLYSEGLTGGWFACAYGPWRRLSRATTPQRSGQALASSRRKSHRFVTMFEEEPALTLVNDWLIDLEFRRLKEPENPLAKHSFDLAVRSIERMLPDVRFRSITSEGEVIFEESGIAVPIHSLSDGYRSTLAWVGDLVRRLVDAFPEAQDPLAARGVVLVDEIDLHLHPKWQRSIVEEVRALFPNLQFVVSSHSPFVAQDAGEADKIIVLRKQQGHVAAREELENVKGWRVDQILTSYLFDLETTRDASVAAVEREYRSLLDRQARGEKTASDEQRVRELKEWLDEHKSAPGETVAENELFEAARSLSRLIDRELAR
jgi:ABC-type hemin transport system ATPase subunit